MIPFEGLLTDEEIWIVIQYERSFAKGRGSVRKGHHRGMGRRSGGHSGPEGMGGLHGRQEAQDEYCQA